MSPKFKDEGIEVITISDDASSNCEEEEKEEEDPDKTIEDPEYAEKPAEDDPNFAVICAFLGHFGGYLKAIRYSIPQLKTLFEEYDETGKACKK